VKDAQGNLVQGRTRWRRFAAVVIPAAAAAGAIVYGMANGAIAASFNVSGQTFKVSADKLEATGFVQYGGIVHSKGTDGRTTDVPVATAGMADAKLTNLCQSVKVPNLGSTGAFGQQAKSVVINGVKQTAWSTSAGQFELKGLHLFVDVNPRGPKECF
jgi:hypothetical protein